MDIFIGKEKYVGTLQGYKKERVFRDVELWTKEPYSDVGHYYDYIELDCLYAIWGSMYEQTQVNPAKIAAEAFNDGGKDRVFALDGDFIFFAIQDKCHMTVFQSNNGMQDIYYRRYDGSYAFGTEPSIFFHDYKEEDIDEASVADFIRYGKMLGESTFSKRVRSLSRGQSLAVDGADAKKNIDKLLLQGHDKEDRSIDEIVDELCEVYLQSVYKRLNGKIADTTLFLSGGMDSRLLLAMCNELFRDKVACLSYGQMYSEEVNCARQTASIAGNPHEVFSVEPGDFLKYIDEYENLTAGMDLIPQSVFLHVLKSCKARKYGVPGSDLTDLFLHGASQRNYLSEDILSYEGNFSDYLVTHYESARLVGMPKERLDNIRKSDSVLEEDHLKEEASKYDSYPASDVFLAFMNNTDGAHAIAWRTNITPGKYMNVMDPSADKKFAECLRQIPIAYRRTDELHMRMIRRISPAYLKPLYNNTNLSLQFGTKYWKESVKIEAQREALYEKVMKEYNPAHEDKIYYPYYYSDFNGYTRYDEDWIRMMDDLLGNRESYIYSKWLDYDAVSGMIKKHRVSEANYRKELILLCTVELFFRKFLHLDIRRKGTA